MLVSRDWNFNFEISLRRIFVNYQGYEVLEIDIDEHPDFDFMSMDLSEIQQFIIDYYEDGELTVNLNYIKDQISKNRM